MPLEAAEPLAERWPALATAAAPPQAAPLPASGTPSAVSLRLSTWPECSWLLRAATRCADVGPLPPPAPCCSAPWPCIRQAARPLSRGRSAFEPTAPIEPCEPIVPIEPCDSLVCSRSRLGLALWAAARETAGGSWEALPECDCMGLRARAAMTDPREGLQWAPFGEGCGSAPALPRRSTALAAMDRWHMEAAAGRWPCRCCGECVGVGCGDDC